MWDAIGSFLILVGIGIIIACSPRKFLKEKRAVPDNREISEFMFRDRNRKLQTVKIIIDPNLPEMEDMDDTSDLRVMTVPGKGEATLHSPEPVEMNKVRDFVFTPQCVRDMRAAGMEPEDLVARMLRDAGRME